MGNNTCANRGIGLDENVYANRDACKTHMCSKDDHTARGKCENEPSEKHCYRRATVCLGLLCVLLLTALIVLIVYYIGVAHNALKAERDQLWTNYTLLVMAQDRLQKNYDNCTATNEQLRECLEVCPHGWKCFNSKLYYISTEMKNWSESQKDCKERGADLVIISSKEEQDLISQFTGPFWIGLSDRESEGTWKWVDGTTLQEGQGYWKENQPDNYKENEDCVETRITDKNNQKTWNDFQCDSKLSWICEKEGWS